MAAGALAAVAALLLTAGGAGSPNPRLVEQLKRGGLVLVLRHAATDQSKQDEDPVDLADCTTQRNLSADGRAQARAIGTGIKRLHLRIGRVLTSRFCRTRETARLTFGRGKVEPALLNTINAPHDAALAPADPRGAPPHRYAARRRNADCSRHPRSRRD